MDIIFRAQFNIAIIEYYIIVFCYWQEKS